MARISKKARMEMELKKKKIISVFILIFAFYYSFIRLKGSSGPFELPEESAGIIGNFLLRTLNYLSGSHDWILIALLFGYCILILLSKENIGKNKIILYFASFPVILGIIHLSVPIESLADSFKRGFDYASLGNGGGILGFLVAYSLIKLFGLVGAYIIGVCALIMLFLHLTDFPFTYMYNKIKKALASGERKPKARKVKQVVVQEELPEEVEADSEAVEEKNNIIPIINNFTDAANKPAKEDVYVQNIEKIIEGETQASVNPEKETQEEPVLKLVKEPELSVETPEKVDHNDGEDEASLEEVDSQIKENEEKSKSELGENPGQEGQVPSYIYPSLDILKSSSDEIATDEDLINQRIKTLEATLASFGVKGKISAVSCGPTITRYEFQPAPGVKVSKVVNLADDIALSMAASGVRIEAPIPGKAAIGVEIPNENNLSVGLRSILESLGFKKTKSKLAVALGKDIAGKPIIADLKKMPHLLIAGATGSGKSVCMNSLIASILFNASPDEVKMIMVDPKMVELTGYNGIPHLITPVVTDPKKAASALRWAVREMENRYLVFSAAGVKNIEGYNDMVEKNQGQESEDQGEAARTKLPYFVVLIDELADLMMVAPADVEDAICRLAQMARAAGIHLVIATQRPSVDVITGIIKANIPSRIAFSVSSQIDSRTILDMNGAEKLLGKGDMLYYPSGLPKPLRVQGVFVSDEEIDDLVMEIKTQGAPKYDEEVVNQEISSESEVVDEEEEEDELLADAAKVFIENGQASISQLQRRFRIGYNRAARIVDEMERKGIVGGFEGSKPRQVLITIEDYERIFGKF